MAKTMTFPVLFDEVLQLKLSQFKKHFVPNQIKEGTVTWSKNGKETAKIGFVFNTKIPTFYLELDYLYNDQKRNYKVNLVSIPSNLGKGEVWYFLCPHTKKRCRKLYLVDGYFSHREAFTGMYECQTKSKKDRNLINVFETAMGDEKAYNLESQKYFKRSYKGKPTKRYLKVLALEREAEKFTHKDIERMMLGIY